MAPADASPAAVLHGCDIKAAPAVVWAHVIAVEHYPQWNPFVRRVDGPLEEGSVVVLTLAPPDMGEWEIGARVVTLTPSSIEFSCEHPDFPGRIIEYTLRAEPIPSGTRFTQSYRRIEPDGEESLAMLDDRARLGVEMYSAALKARAER